MRAIPGKGDKKPVNEIWNAVTGEMYSFTEKKITNTLFCINFDAGTIMESESKQETANNSSY